MAEEHAVLPATVSKRGPRLKGGASLVIQHFEVKMSCKSGKMIQSKTFKVKDATLSIMVFPNGQHEEDKGKVTVYLRNRGQNEVVVESVKLTLILGRWRKTLKAENITLHGHPPGDDDTDEEDDDDTEEEGHDNTDEEEDSDADKEEDQALKPNDSIGWPHAISHKKCKTKLVDGVFKVTMEVEMLGDKRCIKKCTETIFGCYTELPKMSSQWVLEEMYRNHMKDSDFTLVCEGQKIPCHKIILASASPYFKGMMDPTNRQFQEYKEGSVVVQCSEQVGHCFVKFLYTAEIEKTVLEDDIETFLRLADYYQVVQLKQYVEQRMIQSLKQINMVAFYIAGDVYNAGLIREAAKLLIRNNLDWLRGRGDWREAFGDKKDLIIEIIFD